MSPQASSGVEAQSVLSWDDAVDDAITELRSACAAIGGIADARVFLCIRGGDEYLDTDGLNRISCSDDGHPIVRAVAGEARVNDTWPSDGHPGIAVPLVEAPNLRGAVWFGLEPTTGPAGPKESSHLEALARQVGQRVALAIDARQADRHAKALAFAATAGKRLLSETALHRAVRLNVTDLAELSGAREASIWRYDQDGPPNCLAGARGEGPPDSAWQAVVLHLLQEVEDSRNTLQVNDASKSERFAYCRDGGVSKFIAFPIVAFERCYGALLLLDYAEQPELMGGGPEPGVADACRLLAHSTAAAIRGIEASEAVEKAGEETRGLRGLLERSERQAALFDLSRRAAEELGRALGGIGDGVAPSDDVAPEGSGAIDALRLKIDRATDILDEFRALATLAPPELRVTDLNEVIHDAVAEIRSTRGSGGVSLRLQAGLPALLLDAEKVRRMLVNLIAHGIEGYEDAQAIVTSRLQKGQAVVEVRVPGRSTPGSVLESVFVPFGAGDGSRRGVGLSLAQQIIKDHGGQLRAKIEPGEDLLYWLSLPVEENRDRRRKRRDRRASRDRRQSSEPDDGPLES